MEDKIKIRAQTEWFSNSSTYTNKYKITYQKYKNNRMKIKTFGLTEKKKQLKKTLPLYSTKYTTVA